MNSETIITVSIYLFIITSMLFIGLGHTWRDILAPFKNVKLVLLALLVNLILIPVTGYLIATVFALFRRNGCRLSPDDECPGGIL